MNKLSFECYKESPYKSIKHSTYFPVYDRLLGKYQGESITFVEVGVLGGGSLFMWRSFFGEKARIIGVDLNPNAKKWENHGFEIFIGSQSDPVFWKEFASQVGKIDVLLDDGGHTYEQQIVTVECMMDQINDGGTLIVEDVHTSYMNGFGPKKYSFVRYVGRTIDRINARFGELRGRRAEDRVWSVEVFESIVAFHVDRRLAGLVSVPTNNGGESDSPVDYRNFDKSRLAYDQKYAWLAARVRRVKLLKALYKSALSVYGTLQFKARRYFKG